MNIPATTGQPAATNFTPPPTIPNPSGLRFAVEIQGGHDVWLLLPVEILPLLLENAMRFRRSYVNDTGSGYHYELQPEPDKSVQERAHEGCAGASPQLYETRTLIAIQTAARLAAANTKE